MIAQLILTKMENQFRINQKEERREEDMGLVCSHAIRLLRELRDQIETIKHLEGQIETTIKDLEDVVEVETKIEEVVIEVEGHNAAEEEVEEEVVARNKKGKDLKTNMKNQINIKLNLVNSNSQWPNLQKMIHGTIQRMIHSKQKLMRLMTKGMRIWWKIKKMLSIVEVRQTQKVKEEDTASQAQMIEIMQKKARENKQRRRV